VPLPANINPQRAISKYGEEPANCDFTLVFLWARMGSPLLEDETRPDGSRYASGTEWEFENARAAGRDVFVYLRTPPPPIAPGSPEEKQYQALQAFVGQFRAPDGSFRGEIQTYSDPDALPDLLRLHLSNLLRRAIEQAELQRGRSRRMRQIAGGLVAGLLAVTTVGWAINRPRITIEAGPCTVKADKIPGTEKTVYGLAFDLAWDARVRGEGRFDMELEPEAGRAEQTIPPQELGSAQGKIPQFVERDGPSPWKGTVRVSSRDTSGSVLASSPTVALDCKPEKVHP